MTLREASKYTAGFPRGYMVYKITCQTTGDSYVGYTGKRHTRFSAHLSDLTGKYQFGEKKKRMAADLAKYGEEDFIVEVLEVLNNKHSAFIAEKKHMIRERPTYCHIPVYVFDRINEDVGTPVKPYSVIIEEQKEEITRLRELLKEKGVAA